MANRPVFLVSLNETLFTRENTDFTYFSGFSLSQKQKCIRSLHESFYDKHPDIKILEISSSSENPLGVSLSAFNLMILTKSGKSFSVETAFQSSKVFENGGPYKDLLYVSSREAKRDPRLRNSGNVISFCINEMTFDIEPKTYFYNWLYCNTLNLHPDLVQEVIKYDAFTDIAFNPQKSINCQAEACAIYVSLYRQNLLEEALKDRFSFLKVVYPHHK